MDNTLHRFSLQSFQCYEDVNVDVEPMQICQDFSTSHHESSGLDSIPTSMETDLLVEAVFAEGLSFEMATLYGNNEYHGVSFDTGPSALPARPLSMTEPLDALSVMIEDVDVVDDMHYTNATDTIIVAYQDAPLREMPDAPIPFNPPNEHTQSSNHPEFQKRTRGRPKGSLNRITDRAIARHGGDKNKANEARYERLKRRQHIREGGYDLRSNRRHPGHIRCRSRSQIVRGMMAQVDGDHEKAKTRLRRA